MWMSIRDGLAGRSGTLTMAIWSTTPLNFHNVLGNDDTQSVRAFGLSVLLTADAVLSTDAATRLIPETAFPAPSIFSAGSAVLMSEVSSWLAVVSRFIHEHLCGRKLRTQPRGPWAFRRWFRYLHLEISRRWKAAELKAC